MSAEEGQETQEGKEAQDELPRGWARKESKSRPGKFYFFNASTRETSWERPTAESVAPSPKRQKSKHEVEEVRVRHLLCKHKDSRNPSSWRTETITITREEAEDELRGIRERIVEEARDSSAESASGEKSSRAGACPSSVTPIIAYIGSSHWSADDMT